MKEVTLEYAREHYKELPNGTKIEGGGAIVNGGLLVPLSDEIRAKGRATRIENDKKRKSLAATIDAALKCRAKTEVANACGLKTGATMQETLIAAILLIGTDPNNKSAVKAAEFIRDTVGEKPIDKNESLVANIDPDTMELIQRVADRLKKTE